MQKLWRKFYFRSIIQFVSAGNNYTIAAGFMYIWQRLSEASSDEFPSNKRSVCVCVCVQRNFARIIINSYFTTRASTHLIKWHSCELTRWNFLAMELMWFAFMRMNWQTLFWICKKFEFLSHLSHLSNFTGIIASIYQMNARQSATKRWLQSSKNLISASISIQKQVSFNPLI